MRRNRSERTGRSVLVVDDDEQVLRATAHLLEREGHLVLTATRGRDALEMLRARSVDLVLVDYFMPGMTGEELVRELRTFDPYVQVILQTGYANERPPREMLKQLDIQGYHDKNDGPEKLCLWVDVGLRAASSMQMLNKSRICLSYILDVTPALHKIQPTEQLFAAIVTHAAGLFGTPNALLAVTPHPLRALDVEDFRAMTQTGRRLRIGAATGELSGLDDFAKGFTAAELAQVASAVAHHRVHVVDGGTVVALRVSDSTLGFMYLGGVVEERDHDLLALFANQAAVAIHNASLYELAAIDQLTRVYTRTFFEQSFLRELHGAHRTSTPMSVLVVDIDDMKRLNDRGGHLCGDQALVMVGALLRRATRVTDIIGRYGGDEFVIVLPNTDADGARVVAARIVEGARSLSASGSDGRAHAVTLTAGVASLPKPAAHVRLAQAESYFASMAKTLIAAADEGLYEVKRAGKARASAPRSVAWPAESETADGRAALTQTQARA